MLLNLLMDIRISKTNSCKVYFNIIEEVKNKDPELYTGSLVTIADRVTWGATGPYR